MFKPKGIVLLLFFSPFLFYGHEKLEALFDSIEVYKMTDPVQMNLKLEEAHTLIEAEANDYYYGRYYFEAAYHSILYQNYPKALDQLTKGKTHLSDYKDSLLYVKLNHRIANTYFLNGEYNFSLSTYLETVSFIRWNLKQDLRDQKAYKQVEAFCLKNIGVVEYVVFAEQKAIDYYKQATAIFKEIEDHKLLRYTYFSIAGCYLEQDSVEAAKAYIDRGNKIPLTYSDEIELGDFQLTEGYYYLKTNQIDSARYFFKRSEQVYEKFQDEFGLAVTQMHQGEIALKLKTYKEAKQLLEQSYNYLKGKDESRIMLKVQLLLADVYHQLKEDKKAYELVKAALNTEKEILKNAEQFFSYEIESKAAINRYQYNDSLNAISKDFKINQYEALIDQKSFYNQILLIAVLFFIILTVSLILLQVRNKKINRALNESLDEKQILFQEVHHRVKNNFQIISSLMNLQMIDSEDQQLKVILRETQHRILSMSFVHELLYRSNKFDQINVKNYVVELVPSIIQAFASSELKIDFTVNTNNIRLNLNQAIPIGLILNEIITNSVKYAFKGRLTGLIEVEMTMVNEVDVQLTVHDNGIGISMNQISSGKSLGLELIDVLVEQLDGDKTIKSTSKTGTTFKIVFNSMTKNQYLN